MAVVQEADADDGDDDDADHDAALEEDDAYMRRLRKQVMAADTPPPKLPIHPPPTHTYAITQCPGNSIISASLSIRQAPIPSLQKDKFGPRGSVPRFTCQCRVLLQLWLRQLCCRSGCAAGWLG